MAYSSHCRYVSGVGVFRERIVSIISLSLFHERRKASSLLLSFFMSFNSPLNLLTFQIIINK
ncbi:hypothetical protein Hanom_Chr12g01069371 [Helianthus anomalus]